MLRAEFSWGQWTYWLYVLFRIKWFRKILCLVLCNELFVASVRRAVGRFLRWFYRTDFLCFHYSMFLVKSNNIHLAISSFVTLNIVVQVTISLYTRINTLFPSLDFNFQTFETIVNKLDACRRRASEEIWDKKLELTRHSSRDRRGTNRTRR